MLQQVLHEIETAQGPVDVAGLSRKLGVERGALEGMVAFWVRKGRLRSSQEGMVEEACGGGLGCGGVCPGPEACPWVLKLPRSYRVVGSE